MSLKKIIQPTKKVSQLTVETPQSINIAGYHYDKVKHILTIELRDGTKYAYAKVLEHIHKDFSMARDKDQYLQDHIEGKYPAGSLKS
ncbi:MAG: KTSC domain-containing protein [Gammaproteobacteria bacterium]|nr:KTSC domain-containing protein [Gammaproteobacteria bacterium]